jgi:hypothetical protein
VPRQHVAGQAHHPHHQRADPRRLRLPEVGGPFSLPHLGRTRSRSRGVSPQGR